MNLIIYTKEHFGREEAEMRRIQYADEISHKSEHTKLIKQVTELKASMLARKSMSGRYQVSSAIGCAIIF